VKCRNFVRSVVTGGGTMFLGLVRVGRDSDIQLSPAANALHGLSFTDVGRARNWRLALSPLTLHLAVEPVRRPSRKITSPDRKFRVAMPPAEIKNVTIRRWHFAGSYAG